MPFEKAAAFTLRKMNIVCDLRQGNRFGRGGLDERENVFQAADGIREGRLFKGTACKVAVQ